MRINFISVDESNIEDISKLHVGASQTKMIESVEQCFNEARKLSLWRPVAISLDDELIGFAMYGLWKKEGTHGRVWLDRFFIDEHFQSRGYAKLVLPVLLEHIKNEYKYDEIYLSVYGNNSIAIHMYEGLGFEFNGEFDINGEKVMLLSM